MNPFNGCICVSAVWTCVFISRLRSLHPDYLCSLNTQDTNISSFWHSLPSFHSQSDSAGYDPRRSRVSDDTMMDFVRGQISGDLTEVPGIGPKTAEKLGIVAEGEDDSEAVTNTYQLFGKVSRAFH